MGQNKMKWTKKTSLSDRIKNEIKQIKNKMLIKKHNILYWKSKSFNLKYEWINGSMDQFKNNFKWMIIFMKYFIWKNIVMMMNTNSGFSKIDYEKKLKMKKNNNNMKKRRWQEWDDENSYERWRISLNQLEIWLFFKLF